MEELTITKKNHGIKVTVYNGFVEVDAHEQQVRVLAGFL